MKSDNYWSPYLAGAGIGLALLASFFAVGRGLGASSAFSLTAAFAVQRSNPEFAKGLTYFSQYFGSSPFRDWIFLEVCGLFVGALIGALATGNFLLRIDRPTHMSRIARLCTAFSGGILIGFASRLARGCTSGVALSGGAQLAVAGWIFVIAMFISGFLFAAIFRRLWS